MKCFLEAHKGIYPYRNEKVFAKPMDRIGSICTKVSLSSFYWVCYCCLHGRLSKALTVKTILLYRWTLFPGTRFSVGRVKESQSLLFMYLFLTISFYFWGKAFQLVEWETAGRYLLAVHLVSHKPCHSLLLLKAIVGWEEEHVVKRRTNIYLSLVVTDTIYIFITICDRQNSLYLLDVHLTKSFDLLRMENKFTFTKNIAASVMSISVSHSLCLGQFLMEFILPLASCVFNGFYTSCVLSAEWQQIVRCELRLNYLCPQINLSLIPLQLFLSNTNANSWRKIFLLERKVSRDVFGMISHFPSRLVQVWISNWLLYLRLDARQSDLSETI